MGTNYYYETYEAPPCKHCGRYDLHERLHIGKSSMGWVFTMHIHPNENIHTLDGWVRYMDLNPGTIKCEDNQVLSREELLKVITERSRPEPVTEKSINSVHWGYESLKDYYRKNYAEPGPKNLMRHSMKLDKNCVGHAENEGTWSYFIGEFS